MNPISKIEGWYPISRACCRYMAEGIGSANCFDSIPMCFCQGTNTNMVFFADILFLFVELMISITACNVRVT